VNGTEESMKNDIISKNIPSIIAWCHRFMHPKSPTEVKQIFFPTQSSFHKGEDFRIK
jgi:hypothetical protein